MRGVGLLLCAALACSSPSAPTTATPPRGVPDAGAPDAAPLAAYGPDVTSLRLRRSIVVRAEPREDAHAVGTVAQDTRVAWRSVSRGPGCPRWVELVPRGWVCDRYLEPTRKPPRGVELPRLEDEELVPGVYGQVTAAGAKAYRTPAAVAAKKPSRELAGAVTVRREAEVMVGGKPYWRTTTGELIEADKIRLHRPSRFTGIQLDADGAPAFPLAWAQSRKSLRAKVVVRKGSKPGAGFARAVAARTVVPILEVSDDGGAARIGENEWISLADLHVARSADPPPMTHADERWFDVDLDEQVVVAYVGRRPVFATLVSTGNRKWPTPPGIYRVWIKFAETDMNGQMGDEQPYSVATVPWTMFFAKDLALHTAYWHDRFGEPRSHGCVNLSPSDARRLYHWSSPDLPPGWSMAHGRPETPGSIVRIRSKAVPAPELVGYAKRVYEERLARAGQAAGAPGD